MAKLEDLKELAKGIDRNKVKNIQVIGNNKSPKTIFDEFYQALLDDKFDDDEAYSQYFYEKPASNKAYYKLKDRLYERLLNTAFFIDVNKKNKHPLQKAYYTCYKNLAAVRILLGKSLVNPAVRLAKKTIKISTKFELTEVTLLLARILISEYNIIGDLNSFKFYKKLVTKNQKTLKAELFAETSLSELMINFANSNTIEFKYLSQKKVLKRIKKLNKLSKKQSSYKFNLYYYVFILTYYESIHDHYKVLEITNDAFSRLESKAHIFSKFFKFNLLLRKVNALLMLGNYEKAEVIAKELIDLAPLESINWLIANDICFRIFLHQKKFDEVQSIISRVKESPHKQLINKNGNRYSDIWKINEAFLQYLILNRRLKPNGNNNFRLNKFLNEVPIYSKDKKGSNVTILILQILFLLEDRKYDALIDRADALSIYTQRHLKGEGTYRSNCFIKMLLCLPDGNFDREQVEQKAHKYLRKLRAMPIEKAKQSAELEVIPYEMLWEFVLESLERARAGS